MPGLPSPAADGTVAAMIATLCRFLLVAALSLAAGGAGAYERDLRSVWYPRP
jgi:hypothetical protein